ncbi:MAG: hypothetical protein LBE65_02660 [Synergistaceae bacterium]|jgi:hypothetical protein|nr:hypothetical protein [Synergistaceae bacterium]
MMKKCTRCNSVINWHRPFCPLCGGFVTDMPRQAAKKISSVRKEHAPVAPSPANIPPAQAADIPVVPQAPPTYPEQAPAPLPPAAQEPVPAPPLPDAVPPAGLFSQIHQTPAVPAPKPSAPSPAERTPPPFPQIMGSFSWIHQSPRSAEVTDTPDPKRHASDGDSDFPKTFPGAGD